MERFSDLPSSVDGGSLATFDTALAWARAQERSSGSTQVTRPKTLVLVAEGPSALVAAILATALGYRLQICAEGFVGHVRKAMRTRTGCSIIVVARRDEATDDLLMSLSNETLTALASEMHWEHLPKVTILTGRDLSSLSWVVSKAIAALNGKHACSLSRCVRHYTADSHSILMRETDGEGQEGFRVRQGVLDRDALLGSLRSLAAVAGYQTHGVDACAQGGNGVVLCGLHSVQRPHKPSMPGVLACARGYPCPRGPHPLPLAEVRAGVFMLGSCNGLRLADGILHPDFNLGLSFLDGPGYAYVSSIAAGFGSEIGTICFLAAFASGRSLADATMLVNAFVHAAGLDHPSYIAVGLPECRMAVAGAETTETPDPTTLKQRRIQLDFGERCFGEVLIDDSELLRLAQNSRLSVSVSSELDEPVYWFCRLERQSVGHNASTVSQPVLRLFLFRFPHALGRVDIDVDDAGGVRAEVLAALRGLRRWLETMRLTESSGERRTLYSELMESESILRAAVAQRMKGLNFDGSARRTAADLLSRTESLAAVVRSLVVEDLVPRLTGEFWLPNVWSSEYSFVHDHQISCPYCGGIASHKLLRHELHSEARVVVVCLRCLIVSDLLCDGNVKAVTIGVPTVVRAGTSMTASVTVAGAPSALDFEVHLRMTSRGGEVLTPRPLEAACRLSETAETLNFQWDLPRELMPHQYRLKVLVVSLREIAFAQRPFFVGPA